MEKKFFLCRFCGTKIQSSRTNLDRHEKRHASHVSKIQCAAKNCGLTFSNKSYYWTHWTQIHREMKMPDFLIYGEEVKKQRKPYTRKVIEVAEGVSGNGGASDDRKDNREKLEKPNDFLIFNIEHTENLDMKNLIEDCLVRDPFYGYLT